MVAATPQGLASICSPAEAAEGISEYSQPSLLPSAWPEGQGSLVCSYAVPVPAGLVWGFNIEF